MIESSYESTLTLHFADVGSPGHRLQGIILDISSNRLFKAVRVGEPTETRNRPFLNVKFANKGIDALNVSNILNQKSVQSKIEKVPRGIRDEKSSKDMASSRNLVSTIGALASPKMGDGTRCPEG